MLNLYLQDVVATIATAKKAAGRIDRLLDWWGTMMLDEVTGASCRQFTSTKGIGAARRELQDLQAAINHHHHEGLHREIVLVTLPKAGVARERWLTRQEAAKLIRICLHTPEIQDGKQTDKRPLRHLARFILFALYTGSRPGDIFTASFKLASNRGFIDFDSGIFYRKPSDKRATNKRQPKTPLPRRLIAHLKRWKQMGADYVVEFDGRPIKSIKTAFARLLDIAQLPAGIVPYSLRHTCATWKKQEGVRSWEVAGFIGTSEPMVEKHYGHHDPDHLKNAAEAGTQRTPNGKPRTQREIPTQAGTELLRKSSK
ncbi:MAG: site-specific integrase [Methylocella sp.]